MKLLLLISLTFLISVAYAAPVPLPFNFESGSIANGDFLNFNGGTGTVIANPVPGGINTSATVGRMVRNGGAIFAGAYLTTPANVDFSVNPIICMKVYTDAPVGTRIALKMEGCGGTCSREIDAFTTVSGAWETLCYDFTGEPTNYNRVVFLFDLGNVGDGTATSTFLFDDVEQLAVAPLPLTPGSRYFCPNASVLLTFPGAGTYNWYSDPAGTALVQAASSTYTTPILTGSTSYYVRDMTATTLAPAVYGPSAKGGNTSTPTTVSTFFTSNLDNGNFYAADIVQVVIGAPVPCTYTVTIFNLTQGTNRTLAFLDPTPTNAAQVTFTFPTPLPIFLNDQLELRISSSGAPCFVQPTVSGNSNLFLPFPNSFDPQITFTGHTTNGVSDVQMSGMNYRMDGDFVDPALSQVNAIADCALALPIELLSFSVEDSNGDALLNWKTTSETNNDYFLIKRSRDGIGFETIGTIQGQGNSSTTTAYNYTDTEAPSGISYYQLEQVDFDGSKSLSWVVSYEKVASDANVLIFPNPTTGTFTVKTFEASSTLEIKILDLTGRTLEQYNYSSDAGNYNIELDVNKYPAGIYAVMIQFENESRVFKLIKE